MKFSRFAKDFLSYGVASVLGKALALILCLSSPAMAGQVTVLALGDSLTQGYGLPRQDGLVPQLQAWLDAEGEDVTLINGGVSGDTTAGGARRVEWSLTPDVDAMMVILGGNDLLRGIDPAITRRNLDEILQVAAAKEVPVLLVGLRAHDNYGPAYKAGFDALYPDLAKAHAVQFFPYFFEGLGQGSSESYLPYFQRDAIHPNADGVRLIVRALGPATQKLIQTIR